MKNRKMMAIFVAFLILSVSALTGCGSSSTSSNSSSSAGNNSSGGSQASSQKKQYTIALVPGLTTDPFYITMHNGALAEANKLGVNLMWQGATEMTSSAQLPVVNSLISKGVDAMLVAPADANALTQPLKTATQKGTKILTVDTSVADTSFLSAAVTSNNYQGGQVAADTLAKLTHNHGEVAIINFANGATTAEQRRAGFMDEIKKYPGIKVVADEYCDNSQTKSNSQMASIISANPNITGVFGTNLYAAVGAAQAVKSSGKSGKINVIAYDAEPQEIDAIKSGLIYGTVAQNPYKEGQLAMEYAYDALTGKTNFPKSTKLENLVITKANVNDADTQNWIYSQNVNK
jgi:ribose transport system substrate-binding protein